MKKIFALMLCFAMVLSLVACGETNDDTTPADTSSGEAQESTAEFKKWDPLEKVNCIVDAEAKDALKKATDGLDGVTYEPVAVLGTQVVAGINYAILCKSTATTPNATSDFKVLFIYKDLQGNATLSSIADFDLDSLRTSEIGEENLAGGWNAPFDSATNISIEANAQDIFDKAFLDYTGIGITPYVTLARLTVGGGGYAYLAQCINIVPDAKPYYAVVYVVSADDDSYIISDVKTINVADYCVN